MATQKPTPRKAAAAAKPAGDASQGLHVTPKVAGFRRAGRAFPDGLTIIPMSELSEEQYVKLTTEPMLVTYVADMPAAAQEDATA